LRAEGGRRKEEEEGSARRGGTGCGTRCVLLSNVLMSQSATTKAEGMLRTAKITGIA
jgi:hypothetical protein